MLKLTVDGEEYRVEFRHLLSYGRRPALRASGEVKAMTLCSVSSENLIAMDVAACDRSDNFSRREGRWRSFNKVLARCSPLRKNTDEFRREMIRLDPEPEPVVRIVKVLSAEEKKVLIEAGAIVRDIRSRIRKTSA